MKKKSNESTEEWREKVIKVIDREAFLLITLRNDGMGEIALKASDEEIAFLIYHMLQCPQLHEAILKGMAAYIKEQEDEEINKCNSGLGAIKNETPSETDTNHLMPIIKVFES